MELEAIHYCLCTHNKGNLTGNVKVGRDLQKHSEIALKKLVLLESDK